MKNTVWSMIFVAGCATVPPPSRPSEDRRASELQLRELTALEAELSQPQASSAPACERVCPLAENIRRLSGMICQLAARHPDDEWLGNNCREAELHAARARTHIPATCSCGK